MRVNIERREFNGITLGAWVAVGLCVAQVLLILASWLLTAAMPETFTHSLLSAEGIRWFFGQFIENMASEMLVWLVLISIVWGVVNKSGIMHYDNKEYRQRIAMRLVVLEGLVSVAVMLGLTIVPHAILLNVMGSLFPSSFSASLIPYGCLSFSVMSVSFGLISGTMKGVVEVFDGLTCGIGRLAPLYIIYVLGMQLYKSICFVA